MLTSGSTGNPKAVVLTHENILSSLKARMDVEGATAADMMLNWVSFDHVAALLMVHLLAVYVGARQLHVERARVLSDPLSFLRVIDRFRVSVTFTPNFLLGAINDLFRAMDAQEGRLQLDLSCVRHIISGGEANPVQTGLRFLDTLAPYGLRRDSLWPAYGMTETCAAATYSRKFPGADSHREFASVGVPINGFRIRITDNRGDAVPEHGMGNLEVRGPMVFPRYYNNEDATRTSFTSDGWFRTGDLARIEEGMLLIVGRAKDSIIISGVNYSSHELETALEHLEGVEHSFVAAFPTRPKGADTEQLVVAFATTFSLTDEERLYSLIAAVRNTTIMLWGFRPATILALPREEFPKTSLGKIQRALMRQRLEAGAFGIYQDRIACMTIRQLGGYMPPGDNLEAALVDMFAATLSIQPSAVSATASFFDLGGTSMDILKLTQSIETRFNVNATLTTVLQNPTVRELAGFISSSATHGGLKYGPLVSLQLSGRGIPLFCIHPGDGGTLVFVNLAKYFVNERPFYALRPRGFNPDEECFTSFGDLVATYVNAIVEVQPDGPYAIAGYSLGGAIAFEIAKELEGRGAHVAFLASIDGEPCLRDAGLEFGNTLMSASDFLDAVAPKHYSAWARVAQSLQNLSRSHVTSGIARAMTVFYSAGFPPRLTGNQWSNRIKGWDKFICKPKYVEVAGDHVTLLAPKHVSTFQAVLRTELATALGES
jgi:thioesterase domain-containing protein/acyl carrier protein